MVIFLSLFSSWRAENILVQFLKIENHFIIVQFIKNWKSFMKNLIFYCSSVHEVMGRASREASPSKARLLGTWRAKSLTKTTSHENLEKLGKFCTKLGNLDTKISHKNRKPWKSREIRKSLHKTCKIDVGGTLGIQETKIWARKSTKPFGNQDVQGIAQKKQNRFWLPRYHTKA